MIILADRSARSSGSRTTERNRKNWPTLRLICAHLMKEKFILFYFCTVFLFFNRSYIYTFTLLFSRNSNGNGISCIPDINAANGKYLRSRILLICVCLIYKWCVVFVYRIIILDAKSVNL